MSTLHLHTLEFQLRGRCCALYAQKKSGDMAVRPSEHLQSILYFRTVLFCHDLDLHLESFIYDSGTCIERSFPE